MKARPGDTFNDLTVIDYIKGAGKRRAQYLVKCACGRRYGMLAYRLIGKKIKRCRDCANKIQEMADRKRIMPDDKLRFMWLNRHKGMMQRCYNSGRSFYKDYGGRGIQVCNRWHNRTDFLRDIIQMDNWKTKKFQLERKENNENYSPENCKIVSASENCLNRRTSKKNKAQVEQEEIEDEKPF